MRSITLLLAACCLVAAAAAAPLDVVCNSNWTKVEGGAVSQELVDVAYGMAADHFEGNVTAVAAGYKACPAGDGGLKLSSAGCASPNGKSLKVLVNATCPGTDGKSYKLGVTFDAATPDGANKPEVVDVRLRYIMSGDTFLDDDFPNQDKGPFANTIFEWGSMADLDYDDGDKLDADGLPANFTAEHDDDGPTPLPLDEAGEELTDQLGSSGQN